MKSNLQAIDTVYAHINIEELKNEISGTLNKHSRLTNSAFEDVVVNSLPITNEQLQIGIMNVNIHVPNLSIPTDSGVIDNSQPDHLRIQSLTAMVTPLLQDVWGDDYNFDIEQINLIREEKSSFNNIRIEYYSLNI